jgi:plasmid stabilization system protein ParE
MSFEVRITQAAWANAESIYEWIRDQGAPRNAHRWFNTWLRHVRKLEVFPDGRTLAPENGAVPGVEVHHQIFGTHRTLFVVRDEVVFVVQHLRRGCRQPETPDELQSGIDEASPQPAGVVTVGSQIPKSASLAGLEFFAQAVVLRWPGSVGLTNVTQDRILR